MNSEDVSDLSSPLTELPTSPLTEGSSDLSSVPDSPTPPPGWRDFTPPPSQDADDCPRPRKRRKMEPKTRTTQHLDLTDYNAQSEYDRQQAMECLVKALRGRRKIVVVAGAGISVSAGIPDFRSSHGLFRSLRGEHKLKGSGKQLFDASVYDDDAATTNFHEMVRKLSGMSADAKPTPFHRMLARLAQQDRLLRLYTQNVDGLETQLQPLETKVPLPHKGPWPKTIQLHGGLEKMTCHKCKQISDFDKELFVGPRPPACPQCKEADHARTNLAGKRSHGIGRLRPRMVLYNEHNPDDEAIGAVNVADFRTRPDAVVVVGTSMKIPGVRRIVSQMCKIVRDRREGTTIWINRDGVPTGKDLEDCWDLVVKGDSDDVARIANLKEWDDPSEDIHESCNDSDVEKVASSKTDLKTSVPSSPEKTIANLALQKFSTSTLTPPRSPHLSTVRTDDVKPTSPIKLKLVLPPRPVTAQPAITPAIIKNPASAYKKLVDVLDGKENKRKPGRPPKSDQAKKQHKGKKVTASSTGQAKILNKVTKSKNVTIAKTTATKKEPLSPRSKSELNSEQQKFETSFDFNNKMSLGPYSPNFGIVTPPPRSDRETISPTSIPRGMGHLLD